MWDIGKIKYLAEEMVKRQIEMNNEDRDLKEDEGFSKILVAQSFLHRSQIFINRSKKKMLSHFSLNRGSDELERCKNFEKKT